MKTLKTLAITCGGTGGHFYPGLSLARRFQEQHGKVLLLLSGNHAAEQAAIARSVGIEALELAQMPSPNWRHPGSFRAFWRGWRRGERQAVQALRELRPEALLGMGSFASLPAIRAAKKCRIPLFLHDGNARIGKANRWFSRRALHLGTAFPPVNGDRIACPVSTVGMPLRPELTGAAVPDRTDALQTLNRRFGSALTADRRTILIFGGSQGARKINESFQAALPALAALPGTAPFQVIHLTGKKELERVLPGWQKAPFPVLTLPYLEEMPLAFAAADLAIARSGGSSVAELLLFGKAALLIPYPFAAEHHQDDNAAYFQKVGGGQVIANAALPEAALPALQNVFADWEGTLERAAEAGKRAGIRNAADAELAAIAEALQKA